MQIKNLVVVDGFYSDPDQVRKLALNVEYNVFDEPQNFPGSESKKAYYLPVHAERFQELVGRPIAVTPERYVFGKFRLAMQRDPSRTNVHLDGVDWTGVIYLTPDEFCSGGLGFYRHRRTGLVTVPQTAEELAKFGCGSVEEFDREILFPDSKDLDAWELIHEVQVRYNRLVLFRGGEYFHSITEKFGDSPETSRLTQNFFFNEA